MNEEATSAGGIIMASTGAAHQSEGVVESVGKGVLLNDGSRSKPCVKKGDRILFSGGTIVDHQGQGYIFLTETNVLAVL